MADILASQTAETSTVSAMDSSDTARICFIPRLSAIEWGSRVLADSLPSDLFLVDELGPLELLHAAGWASALPALREAAYRLGLVVVRQELLENARAALPVAGTIHLDRSCNPEAEALRWWEQVTKRLKLRRSILLLILNLNNDQ